LPRHHAFLVFFALFLQLVGEFDQLAQDRVIQTLFALEVVVDELLVAFGLGGDLVYPGACQAFRRELFRRRLEDPLTAVARIVVARRPFRRFARFAFAGFR
jgi:hypothetical protein